MFRIASTDQDSRLGESLNDLAKIVDKKVIQKEHHNHDPANESITSNKISCMSLHASMYR